MVYFRTLPGVVALCIVLVNNLASAAPSTIADPILDDVVDPLLTGVGNSISAATDGSLANTVNAAGGWVIATANNLGGAVGAAVVNLGPPIGEITYVQP